MAYEIHLYPSDSTSAARTVHAVAEALSRAGLSPVERPDSFGHWLDLEGHESRLYLQVREGIVSHAAFRYVTEDPEAIVTTMTDVFHKLGWRVSDDDGGV